MERLLICVLSFIYLQEKLDAGGHMTKYGWYKYLKELAVPQQQKLTISAYACALCTMNVDNIYGNTYVVVTLSAKEDSPVVVLGDNASARGFVTHTHKSTKPVYTFTGIPFAEKPVRFLPAETLRLWNGMKDATKEGNYCYQNSLFWKLLDPQYNTSKMPLSEDCLNLNIWTPSLDTNSKHAVMVWIHGGGFSMGSGSGYEGTALASFHDIVFVSINYRVAGLGFLTTGDSHAPGNMGYHDQVEALRWVQRYIHKFGGDPQKVTIFGESAGGFSTTFHLLSPASKALFKRAISQSGASLAMPSDTAQNSPTGIALTKRLAERLNCPTSDTKDMVACLREQPADAFHNETEQFAPVIDGHLLPDFPYNLYTAGQFNTKDHLLGFTSHEGFLLINMVLPLLAPSAGEDVNITSLTVKSAKKILTLLTQMVYGQNEQIQQRLFEEYLEDRTTHEELLQGLTDCDGDLWLTPKIWEAAMMHSAKAKTFFYLYNYRGSIVPKERPDWVQADHGDDIVTTLGYPHFNTAVPMLVIGKNTNFSDEDRTFSNLIMSYWTNFAKTGDPNGEGLPKWPRFYCDTKEYLELNTSPSVAKDYMPQRMNMWMIEIPKLDQNRTYKGYPWKCKRAQEKTEL